MTDGETSALYIHLYFDEDVSIRIVDNLRTRGFDVLASRDADMWANPMMSKCYMPFLCAAQL
jgi:hypothetical protein